VIHIVIICWCVADSLWHCRF